MHAHETVTHADWLNGRFLDLRSQGVLQDCRLDDHGNGRRFILLHGEIVRYCHAWRSWYRWDGGRWIDDPLSVDRLASDVQGLLLLEAAAESDSRRMEFLAWARRSGSANAVRDLLICARSHVQIWPEQFDSDPDLLNFQNGTLELSTGRFRDAWYSDYLTKQIPHAYRPEVQALRFSSFLGEIMEGDEEMVSFLQRALGSSLLGRVRDHKVFLGVGPGGNGKGTLCRALQHALGPDYAMEAPPGLLLRRRGDSHPAALADLYGMRLVTCQEIGQGKELDEELVKRVTGGDLIKARRLYQDYFQFAPSHSLWAFTNHRPQIQEAGRALWRRVILVPFEFMVPEDQMNLDLDVELQSEALGILSWLVDGCRSYLELGLSPPAKVTEATADYQSESDSVGRFLEECCRVLRSADIGDTARKVYDTYVDHCKGTGCHYLPMGQFKEELQRRGFRQKKTNKAQIWCGIQVESGG